MKRMNLFLAFLAVGSIGFMSSCSEDTGKEMPTVSVTGLESMYRPGSDVTFTVNVTDIEGDVKSVTVTPSEGEAKEFAITGDTALVVTWKVPATYAEAITFDITATDGTLTSEAYTASISTGAAFTTQTSLKLGDNTNATLGSYYVSLATGKVYLSAAAGGAGSKDVDLVFYTNGTTHYFAAPSAADAARTSTMTTKNATKIAASTLVFADLKNDGLFAGAAVSGDMVTPEAGKAYAFETAATSSNPGRRGVIMVDSKSGSEMTITVKITSAAVVTK